MVVEITESSEEPLFCSRMLLHALLYTDFSHPVKEADQLSDRSGCVYAEMEVIDSSQMGFNELESTPFPLSAWNCSSVGVEHRRDH